MDWRSTTFDWNRARAFLVTAEEGSFSAAARALGISQPTIGRQVAALEQELDVVLFERVGHGLQLTATGNDLLEHVRPMGEAAVRVSLTAAGQSLSIDGQVCISAAEIEAFYVLPPIVARLRESHPGIEIELVATNATSDLGRREADIAVRSFRPKQPELVARKVRDGRAWLYATPDYLARLGNPTTAADLSKGQFLGFDRSDTLIKGLNAMGLSLTPDNFPVIVGNQLVQWELAKQGVGICIMTEEVGDPEPRVVRALEDFPPFPVPTWLTTHRELNTSRRLRVVFDRLAEELSAC
ncbi:HTH-type transcriptional regulator TdfR [Enhygromyxa salina]|uniref:HTH-type transcriptional regulator TdfR n=1 Tax=Enhygromyxa salina TaxID=215803 RepID=A0A2S9YJZ8_9BACT|nr:LysR family transcriptional regulator [Enhygromyxa salina]PRQ05415.1 HTH-type transcriptional regulator TdfR [Enhygromyxa salina]